MSALLELSAAVHDRRSDMGLTQTTLARLSGLSRATVNQVENGTIKDLSLTRAAKLLGVLGLSVSIAAPRATKIHASSSRSKALDLAARTANVSYKTSISARQLRHALLTDETPAGFAPHLHSLLDEAPVSLLASVIEQLHEETKVPRTQLWKTMRTLAAQLQSSRDLWQ